MSKRERAPSPPLDDEWSNKRGEGRSRTSYEISFRMQFPSFSKPFSLQLMNVSASSYARTSISNFSSFSARLRFPSFFFFLALQTRRGDREGTIVYPFPIRPIHPPLFFLGLISRSILGMWRRRRRRRKREKEEGSRDEATEEGREEGRRKSMKYDLSRDHFVKHLSKKGGRGPNERTMKKGVEM